MKLSSIMCNSIRLDGGSMFGNAPKAMWEKWIDADSRNRINLSTRALLVETNERRILFETGAGAWMKPEIRKRYGIMEDHNVLLTSLDELGVGHHDITDIILSHLHFDHSGGMLSDWREDAETELLFPNARVIVSKSNWERSLKPHKRDKASFIPVLNDLVEKSGRLVTIEEGESLSFDEINIDFIHFHGHSPGMICSIIKWQGGEMLFGADLLPGIPWIRKSITMGYDRFPELLIDEKKAVLDQISEKNAWIFFTHDPLVSAAKLVKNGNEFNITNERLCFTRELF